MTDVRNATLESDGWHVTEIAPACASITPATFSMALGAQGYVVSYTAESCADAYTGPLDLLPGAVVAFDQFAPSAAYLAGTNNYALLERSSDNATHQFQYESDGSVDQAAIILWRDASGAATAIVREWGEAVADNVAIAPTVGAGNPAVPPTWLTNQVGGICSFDFDGSTQFLGTESNITLPDGAYTIFAVVKNDSANGIDENYAGIGAYDYVQALGTECDFLAGEGRMAHALATSDGFGTDGIDKTSTRSATFSNSAYHILTLAFSFSAFTFRCDGAAIALANDESVAPVASIAGKLGIGNDDGVEAYQLWDGKIAALYIYNGIKSGAEISTVEGKLATNFGITLP